MFLLDPESKPQTTASTYFNYLAGIGLALFSFDLVTSWLRDSLLRPRFHLPYPLKEWSAEDEFYHEDEQYMTVYFDLDGSAQRDAPTPITRDFKPQQEIKPIIGSWGRERHMPLQP